MGGFLTQPLELIRVQRGGTAAFRYAAAEMQGYELTSPEDALRKNNVYPLSIRVYFWKNGCLAHFYF